MRYSNGQLEQNQQTGKGEPGPPGLLGIGFRLTDDGNFDIDEKRLTSVSDPIKNNDAATKSYVDNHLGSGPDSEASKAYVNSENAKQNLIINEKASKSDLDDKLSIDGSNAMNANLDISNNKVVNLSPGTEGTDAVNKAQLDSHTSNNQVNYHLQPSFTFFKNFGNNAQINFTRLNFGPADHFFNRDKHQDLHVVEKEGFDNGFGGQAWTKLKMTNDKLPSGVYTCLFEIFASTYLTAPIIADESR